VIDPRFYRQVAAGLREQIADGRLKPGSRVPTFVRISTETGFSVGTAARAVHLLTAEGLLKYYPGRGYYVR
jgi:DNA-binding GntR family transcriptional regulator